MKVYLSIIIAFVFLASCGPKKHERPSDSDSTESLGAAPAQPSQNSLSQAEKNEGWKLLFDGNSMNGWRSYKNLENNSWEASDGTLHCKPVSESGPNNRSDLMTVAQYENFDLTFDWKVSPQANTGIIYKVTEEYNQPFESGPEFQLMDDAGSPGDVQKWQLTGACYAMFEPRAQAKINPPGEWNQGRLVIHNNHVEHWVNNVKVVEYEVLSDEWKKRKKDGKWKDSPGYGLAKIGHIDLQDHQHEVWFRNLKIKTL